MGLVMPKVQPPTTLPTRLSLDCGIGMKAIARLVHAFPLYCSPCVRPGPGPGHHQQLNLSAAFHSLHPIIVDLKMKLQTQRSCASRDTRSRFGPLLHTTTALPGPDDAQTAAPLGQPSRSGGLRRTAQALALGTIAAAMLGLAGCGSTPEKEIGAGMSTENLYADAKDDMEHGNYETAVKKLEKVEGRGVGTTLSQQAELDLAYSYYKTGEKAQAYAKLDRFIRLHPTSPAADYALYLQGLVNFNDDLGFFGHLSRQDLSERDQQAMHDAYDSFKQLVDQYPASKYATDAKLRMNYIINSLAASEVNVARYYLRRGAFVAAANRAQRAIQEFPKSPMNEQALFIMVKSYDQLGLTQLRDDAKRVLLKNYPQTSLLEGGFKPLDKPWWQLW